MHIAIIVQYYQQNIATILHGTVSVSLYVVNFERTAILIFSMQSLFHQKPGVTCSKFLP